MIIKMISIILGGGQGSRLYPLTKERSKPAVPIGGKYRLIDIPISNCINSGVKRMFVLTQFNSASLNTHIKNTYQFDAFGTGFVDILAAEQTPSSGDWFQGTADAVKQCLPHTKHQDYDYILILSGDQLYQMNFETMAKKHIELQADITIATLPVNAQDATGFGILKMDEQGMITDFVEKPSSQMLQNWKSPVAEHHRSKGEDYLASMGIYIFNRATLHQLFEQNPKSVDFGKEIIPTAIRSQYRVASYHHQGYWTDIGNIRSFYEANLALTDSIPAFNLFDEHKQVYTRPRMLGPSKISGTTLNQVLIADAAMVHAKHIERSVIGLRSRIGFDTVIRNSIIFGNDYFQQLEEIILKDHELPMGIGDHCIIENAIIEKDCRIGDRVMIRGGDQLQNIEMDDYCVVDGIIVLKKGVTIASGTKIGI